MKATYTPKNSTNITPIQVENSILDKLNGINSKICNIEARMPCTADVKDIETALARITATCSDIYQNIPAVQALLTKADIDVLNKNAEMLIHDQTALIGGMLKRFDIIDKTLDQLSFNNSCKMDSVRETLHGDYKNTHAQLTNLEEQLSNITDIINAFVAASKEDTTDIFIDTINKNAEDTNKLLCQVINQCAMLQSTVNNLHKEQQSLKAMIAGIAATQLPKTIPPIWAPPYEVTCKSVTNSCSQKSSKDTIDLINKQHKDTKTFMSTLDKVFKDFFE